MFESVQKRGNGQSGAMAVDIAPLIDVVFILLIFFLVTATFVQETGVDVERPEAVQSEALESASMRISVTPSGAVYTEGQQVELDELRQRVRQFVEAEADGSVIVIPDEQLPSGRLVAVMDAARAGGAQDIALATRQPR